MNLKKFREFTGTQQREVAHRMRYSVSALGRMEARDGEGIKLANLKRYVEACGAQLHLAAILPDGSRIVIDTNLLLKEGE